mgnify:FL=1
MKCKYWQGNGLGCGHYGPENCKGHDMDCVVIDKPTTPNPVPNCVYESLKARNAGLLSAAKEVMNLLHTHGPEIVRHLMDTDENPGQRLRDAIAKAEEDK